MRKIILLLTTLLSYGFSYGQNWESIKAEISPVIELPHEYDTVYRQALSTRGWEDGVHISEDGLNLYCTYVPIDLLSFVLNGDLPNDFSAQYLRGAPTFGMDLLTNPIGATEWLHSDILYAQRNTVMDPFSSWTLSDMARVFYSEGAPSPSFTANSTLVEFMVFTSNDNATNNTDIWLIKNTSKNPSGTGAPMPFPINTLNNEDNPHLVRIDNNNLILFFDSDNLPGGKGDIDIWFSESNDNGATWNSPSNLNSINTIQKEHQPFLHKDLHTDNWFLYYSSFHTDGKLAIFRAEQLIDNDWYSWGDPQLVLSAGNSAGVGEPTLTENGDISFVVVYADPDMNSIYDRFDADPWFLERGNTITGHNEIVMTTFIYPNPVKDIIKIDSEDQIRQIKISSSTGKLVFTGTNKIIKVDHLSSGMYYLDIQFESGETEQRKLIKQ
ncbi:T9SS type A sorting domain-containing protein [Marivirga sp. S37H4]|uniref:T9SS type A sorting domain-containing protein n=1 Tax=Marivirga aurantiaca TaxID=2802615 RepID=A0A935CB73_9BACT|nr:T9SS type A sorting domain-containing protein [Marivirga aurantiaca]MBK6265213.1 T9SS type A sorting domain-containing protein [Marivirga aurantiaca]